MVNAPLVLLTFIRSRAGNSRQQIQLLAACMIPGLAIALFFTGTVVTQWRGTLFNLWRYFSPRDLGFRPERIAV